MSGLPTRMWNEFNQFICTSTKVIPVEKTQIGCILMMSQGLKKSFKRGTNNPTSDLSEIFKKKLGIPAQTLINSIQCKTFVVVMEIKSNLRRKKIHRTNHGPNFNRGSFSNRDNKRTPILFRGEGQSQHFKRLFFLKRQTHPSRHQCHRKGQLKEADFSYQDFLHHSSLSCRSDSSLGAKSRCYLHVGQIQDQEPTLSFATNRKHFHTLIREQYQHRQQYYKQHHWEDHQWIV